QHDKYIEKIVDHHNGTTADFYHRFPIEISIPKERVNRLEDVRVKIAVFDYELPDHHTVKLSATVHITGLVEEVEKIEEEDIVIEEIDEKEEKDLVIEDIKDTENIEDVKDTRKTDEVKNETKPVEKHKNQIVEKTKEKVKVAKDHKELIKNNEE